MAATQEFVCNYDSADRDQECAFKLGMDANSPLKARCTKDYYCETYDPLNFHDKTEKQSLSFTFKIIGFIFVLLACGLLGIFIKKTLNLKKSKKNKKIKNTAEGKGKDIPDNESVISTASKMSSVSVEKGKAAPNLEKMTASSVSSDGGNE